jgi:hypothetical protein
MHADQESVLKHVHFDNLSNPIQNDWGLTGAVTFYESPVKIMDSRFSNNRCEDSLNIVRSNFKISGSVFYNSYSDAFDADFSQGTIADTTFIDSSNDAIDFSGSVIDVKNITIKGAGDKGISAGEGTTMKIDAAKIDNTEIAIASKDKSEIVANNVFINNSKVGFAVFQKKSEFGAASIITNTTKLLSVDIPFLVEIGSSLTVEGKSISSNQKKVKDILYGSEYGKSSL